MPKHRIIQNHPGSPATTALRNITLFLMASASIAGAEILGTIDLAGDPDFDSGTLATSETPPRRWHSFPGNRLCLNPSSKRDFLIEPMSADLPLDLGAYAGTEVVRLPRVLTACIIPPDSPTGAPASAPLATWFPYQITFESQQPGGGSISGFDFFPDERPALIRVLKAKATPGSTLRLAGNTATAPQIRQSGENAVILVSNEAFHFALCFKSLAGGDLKPSASSAKPELAGNAWTIDLPVGNDGTACAIGFGFSPAGEGADAAVSHATGVFAKPVGASLAAAKARMDALLAKVPKPGLTGLGDRDLPADRHLKSYYMAWAFLFQSTIDPLPENPAYPHPQMSLGKSALWAEGHPLCPATCGWESFLGIQWLALVDPEFGWKAYQGIMSLVDADGKLGGESLPSRKAQTAWTLFQQQPDRERLAAVYPAIRRYLLWRGKNPRWIYGDNAAPYEKDIEFAASWSFDVRFAIHIAETLGLKDDAVMWREQQSAMTANMKSWFFRDPSQLHQFYFADRGIHTTPQRNEFRPVMILSALATPSLPADMRDRLMDLFNAHFKPTAPNGGFSYTKYPDNQFVALGLMDHRSSDARRFIEAILRDSIRCGEFAETIELKPGQPAMPGGVKPSLFTALNIIEFTWLLNGVRYDGGRPVLCELAGNPETP